MIRMEPNVVLKYCGGLDEFLKLRVFTPEEASELFRSARISNRRAYQHLVINACIVNYNDGVLPHLQKQPNFEKREQWETKLYELCVEVNPSLEISNVSLPVEEPQQKPIHLIQRQQGPKLLEAGSRLHNLEQRLRRRVIGQPEAIRLVAQAVRRCEAGLRDARRPKGTFLFVGQTGVGKTELAKALAEALYEDPSHLVRVDCSEYSLPHEYAKLIGAPPGYIGHKEGGHLTEAMKQRRSAVVLFDEIEKADIKVHDLLLQLFDEGFLTDSQGGRVSFQESMVILTSNLGAEEARLYRERIGFDARRRAEREAEGRSSETLASLKREFKPEFVNRIDRIVVFRPLTLPDCIKIVRSLLKEVEGQLRQRQIGIRITAAVERFLAAQGFRPEYGARELRRTVERLVQDCLADMILDGRTRPGDTVSVRVRRNRLAFQTIHAN